MTSVQSDRGTDDCQASTRREFLRQSAVMASTVGLSLTTSAVVQARPSDGDAADRNCILLFLVGGPSHLDTWDPKPHAPETVRGPFRPIRTNVPGIHICEHLPLMAALADRYALVRSVTHRAAPIHELGHQAMQTGHTDGDGPYPHYGAVLSWLRGPRHQSPPFVLLPGPIAYTGITTSHGQGAGCLDPSHEPFTPCRANTSARAFNVNAENRRQRERYGHNTFGQSCLLARRLVEHGVRLVTVNMFDTVFNRVTWDCHADGGSLATGLDDYRTTVCPMFDRAYSALLEDLHQRGLLDETLVVAMGEFGRTPYLNPRGGRDHWTGVWTVLVAGGGVQGGQVIGSSDRLGGEPKDRPVGPPAIAATVYHALGVDAATRIPGPDGRPVALVQADPIHELFGGERRGVSPPVG